MAPFQDPEAAAGTIERIEALTFLSVGDTLARLLEGNAAPDRALNNLERWLHTTASPRMHLEQVVGMPRLGELLLTILGASQPVADALIQNPELASLVLEPGELTRVPNRAAMREEGERLLAAATSHRHALDRLRFLKQRWTLPIVINDLAGAWPQETVWRALSDLADTLISLGTEAVWADLRKTRDLPETCPVMVVAFGKLGGREVNYSSDVDLVYVLPDGTDERLERECSRFCEALGRALSDPMGRGKLFRVDLRLRPYGGAGPIIRSMRSYEAYYSLYAEAWEVQALLRSRPVCGPEELTLRWEALREERCFRGRLSEIALEQMLEMRAKLEGIQQGDDLKRGPGGIRDVEFLTQVYQMLHGHERPSVRELQTCDALRALDGQGLLEHSVAGALVSGYTFLRMLEHRIQLVGDRQTHAIPEDPAAREALAKMMGCPTWAELAEDLEARRRTIRTLYRSTFQLAQDGREERAEVLASLGPLGPAAAQWFDLLPESDAFYAGLRENAQSLGRVRTVLERAPALVAGLKASVPLTEQVVSGEIEEEAPVADRLERLAADAEPKAVATAFASGSTAAATHWCLTGAEWDLSGALTGLWDALIRHVANRLGVTFDILALGSYGCEEPGVASDADLLLLIPNREGQRDAEQKAQEFLLFLKALARYGAAAEVDLRLRPEGGKGLLVRTYDGLKAYDLDGMEMWERFALGHARLVHGRPEALALVHPIANGLPLTPERLKELVRMKKRIESERVPAQYQKRNVKLGYGGLNDIEWLVRLHEMRYPTATRAGRTTRIDDRIRTLGEARLLNMLEVEELLEARRHLLSLRAWIHLQGLSDDVMPENPDKLDRLAHAAGYSDGYDLLRSHEQIVDGVRRRYLEGLERLRA